MCSKETEFECAKLFMNLANFERQVEINRQVINQNEDFDPYQTFCYLDKENKNYIDAINIIDFLNKNQVYTNQEEINFIILFYDENKDCNLNFPEFLNFILCENNLNLRQMAREKIGNFMQNQNFPFNVEYSLVKLFERELDLVKNILLNIKQLKCLCDFNVHDLYHLMKGYGCITIESLKNFSIEIV